MTHLTGNIFSCGLPEGVHDPYILNSASKHNIQGLFWLSTADKFPDWVVLPPGSYRLIGVWPVLSEQQAGEVVEKVVRMKKIIAYKDYRNTDSAFSTALESLNSLMEAKGITGTVAIIEKLKP